MELMNLWDETIETLNRHHLSWGDVISVQNESGRIARERFEELSKETWYNDGYGRQEIDPSLIILGYDWWLQRDEYDGSEWWGYYKKPDISTNFIQVSSLTNDY